MTRSGASLVIQGWNEKKKKKKEKSAASRRVLFSLFEKYVYRKE